MPDLLQFSCTNRMLWAEHFCPLQQTAFHSLLFRMTRHQREFRVM